MSGSLYYLEGEVDLSGGSNWPFMLSTVKWPDWHMAVLSGSRNLAGVSGDPGKAGYFVFEKRGSPPNEYYLISPQSVPEIVYMGNDSTGNVQVKPSANPTPEGQWKIEPQGTTTITEHGVPKTVNYYHFTPLRWSNWHMYVDGDPTGNVRGWGDNPGTQAQILFKKIPG